MRSYTYCLTAIVLAALMLTGCTRNRPAPQVSANSSSVGSVTDTQTGAPVVLTPAVEPLTDTAASGGASGVAAGGAEPQVATTVPDFVAASESAASAESSTETGTGSASQTVQYTVQDGDTLSSIAAQFDTTLDSLRQLNFLVDDSIQTGQVLRVSPGAGAAVTTEDSTEFSLDSEPYLYTVQPGDTLYGVAIQFGVDATDIIEANGLLDQNSLILGSDLIIPGYQPSISSGDGSTGTGASNTSGIQQVTYVVEAGDTLTSIAGEYGVDAASIANANGIQNGNLLRVGQQIFIPGITPEEAAALNQVIHVVQPGEGLLAIAVQYGVTTEEIVQLNNIQNTDILYTGQQLIIPGN